MKNSTFLLVSSFAVISFSAESQAQLNSVIDEGAGKFSAAIAGNYNPFAPTGTISKFNAANGAVVAIDGPLTAVGNASSGTAWNVIDVRSIPGNQTEVSINGNLNLTYAPNTYVQSGTPLPDDPNFPSLPIPGDTDDDSDPDGNDVPTPDADPRANDTASNGIYINQGTVNLNGNSTLSGGPGYASNLGKSAIFNIGGTLNVNGDLTVNVTGGKGIYASNAIVNMNSTSNVPYLYTVNNSSNQRGIDANNGSKVKMDMIKMQGTSSSSNGIGIHATGLGTEVSFMGGSFNENYTSRPGATGLWAQGLAKIDVKGYDNGSLTANASGNNEKSVWAFGGGQIDINSEKHANFITNINTYSSLQFLRKGMNGVTAGSLGAKDSSGNIIDAPARVGSKYGNAAVNIYGETHINVADAGGYGIRAMGDGAQINLKTLSGAGRSSVFAKATAINFAFADGYTLDTSNNLLTGGQQINIENTDITHDGTSSYLSGNLIQVGGTTISANDGMNTGIMQVPDAVTNATLNLKDSTAFAVDGKDLMNVANSTYGGTTANSSIAFNADNSTLVGHISTAAGSTSGLNLTNGSVWYLTSGDTTANNGKASNLSSLTTASGTHVYLNSKDLWLTRSSNQPTNYNELTVGKLDGTGVFHFHTDIENGQTDRLIVTDNSSTGQHIAHVKNDGAQNTDGSEVLHIIKTEGGPTFKLQNDALVELGAYTYGLRRNADDPEKWELYHVANSSTSETFNTFIHTNYLLTYLDTQTLLQRMGELRYNKPRNNLWVKGITGKLNSFGRELNNGYKMDYDGIQAGLDFADSENRNGQLYGGVMLGIINADQDFRDGDGSADNLHAGIYGGYMADNGFYYDAVLKYSRLKNKFNVLDSALDRVTTSGRTNAYTASLETGKRFWKDNWFIEPQIQASYTYQQDYSSTASNGLHVDFDSYNSLLLRGSAVLGYEFHQQDHFTQVYFKTGYIRELLADDISYRINNGNKHKNDFSGGWWENALGINARFGEHHNIYAEAGYRTGNLFNQYQADLGYRYEF